MLALIPNLKRAAALSFLLLLSLAPKALNANAVAAEAVPLSQTDLGAILNPRTSAEIAANVTPSNYAFFAGDIRRYGGAGDDSAYNDTAFTHAFAQFKSGGSPIHIPAGTYRVASQLLYALSDPNTTQTQGLIMRGDGMYRSIIKSSAAAGAALRISITDVDSAAFQNGVVLSDFAIIPDGAPARQHGLQLTGVYSAQIERIRIEGVSGHGIYQPDLDATFAGGPDYYSAAFLRLWGCQILHTGLHGIWSEMGAAFMVSMRDNVIQSNRQGGVYLAGAGAGEIKGGSISFNGTNRNDYGGLTLDRSAGSFASVTQTFEVSRVEFDGNHNRHIRIRALNQAKFHLNRFVSHDDSRLGKHVPATDVQVALVAGGNVKDVVFERNYHRRDGTAYALTAYDLGNNAHVGQIEIIDPRYSDTTNVTKYANAHPGSRIQIEEDGIIQRTNLAGSFARGRITSGAPVVRGRAANVVWSSESADPNNALNTNTGVYTCLATGVYSIAIGLTVVSLEDGDLLTLQLIQNTGTDFTAQEVEYKADGSTNYTAQLATKLFCKAGHTLRVRALQNSGRDKRIRVGEPYNWFAVSLDAK